MLAQADTFLCVTSMFISTVSKWDCLNSKGDFGLEEDSRIGPKGSSVGVSEGRIQSTGRAVISWGLNYSNKL